MSHESGDQARLVSGPSPEKGISDNVLPIFERLWALGEGLTRVERISRGAIIRGAMNRVLGITRLTRPRRARVLPAVFLGLTLLVAGAGCFEANGSLEVLLSVGETEPLDDFLSMSFTIRAVRAKPQGENPLSLDPVLDQVDVLGKAGEEPFVVSRGTKIVTGAFSRVDLLIQPPQAVLKNGTTAVVHAVNDALIFEFAYPVEKDKTTGVVLTFNLVRTNTTQGPFYSLVEDPDRSGAR